MIVPTPSFNCSHPAVKCGRVVCGAALNAGIEAGIGALTALALTAVCPAAAAIPAVGAIFGAVMGGTTALTASLTSPSLYVDPQTIERSWLNTCHGIPYAVGQTALAIIVGALAATAFTMAIGLPITFTAIAVFVAVPAVMAGTSLALRSAIACLN